MRDCSAGLARGNESGWRAASPQLSAPLPRRSDITSAPKPSRFSPTSLGSHRSTATLFTTPHEPHIWVLTTIESQPQV